MMSSIAAVAPHRPLSDRVPRPLRIGLQRAGQFVLLVGMFYAGTALVRVTGVPLPGNLVGMLLLLVLLRLGAVRLEYVEDVAALLLKHLNLFFIPLAVGLMAWGGLLGTSGAGLGVSLAGSATVCLAIAGLTVQGLVSQGGSSDAR